MSFTKVAPAGIGTEPGTSILIGDSLLHSTGIDIGSNTGAGVTIRQHGDATFTGIITASAFYGDGSGLEGVSSSGIGTPLSDDDTSDLNKIYYVNQELSIGSTVTVNHPSSAVASYTHYQDLVVTDDADFIVANGDTFIPDVLGIRTSTSTASAATGGRIRAGTITNAGANGAPNFPNGLTGTAGTFTGNLNVGGVLTYEDVTNVDSVGLITARSGIRIGTGGTVGPSGSGIVTYFGDGSQLTGISASAISSIASDGANRVLTSDGDGTATAHSFVTIENNRLSVNRGSGSGAFPLIVRRTDASGIIAEFANSSGYGLLIGQNSATGEAYLRTGTGQPLVITTNAGSGITNERLRISSAGIVTKPNQPCASMTIDSNTISGNYMTHSSVHTNNGNHYNTSTSKFVCPVAGLYYVSIMVMSNNSNTTMDLEFHINGSNSNNILVPYQAATGGQYNQVSGSTIVSCAANAELQFKLNSGSIYGGRHSNMTFALFA